MTGVHQVLASTGGAGLIQVRPSCTSGSSTGNANTTLDVPVPTVIFGFSEAPQVGDLLFAFVSRAATTGSVTWSAGWTELEDASTTTLGLAYAWKICTLADLGTNLTITSTNSVSMSAAMIGIMNHDSASAPVDGTAATASGLNTVDPPANTAHSWGTSVDTLFITVSSFSTATLISPVISAPSGYTLIKEQYDSQRNSSIVVAAKVAKATTDNPGTFQYTDSGNSRSNTIAIRGLV